MLYLVSGGALGSAGEPRGSALVPTLDRECNTCPTQLRQPIEKRGWHKRGGAFCAYRRTIKSWWGQATVGVVYFCLMFRVVSRLTPKMDAWHLTYL